MATQSSVQVPEFEQVEAKTAAEILSALDDSVATAKSALAGIDDSAMGDGARCHGAGPAFSDGRLHPT
jgi:hypothetical protein